MNQTNGPRTTANEYSITPGVTSANRNARSPIPIATRPISYAIHEACARISHPMNRPRTPEPPTSRQKFRISCECAKAVAASVAYWNVSRGTLVPPIGVDHCPRMPALVY